MPNRHTKGLDGLLGRSKAMEALKGEIVRFAPSGLCIHVHGETGTGKERVAEAVHDLSGRRGRFVPFNAAGLSEDLSLSQLFGHARGAFTGAHADRDGYAGQAEGGTLFIDEVAELSPRAQAQLLRFLDEREYCRLGEGRIRRADVRVVSATNDDVEQLVRERRFRADLWYRINDIRLAVPPLRERGEDVVLLARHFLAHPTEGTPPAALSREAATVVARHPWPGNVRQLAKEMRKAAVMAGAEGGIVHPSHLSQRIVEPPSSCGGSLQAAREDFDRRFVGRVLARHEWRRTPAAAEMGISRQWLFMIIRRLRLQPDATGSRLAPSPRPALRPARGTKTRRARRARLRAPRAVARHLRRPRARGRGGARGRRSDP